MVGALGKFVPFRAEHAIEQVAIKATFVNNLTQQQLASSSRWQVLRQQTAEQFPIFTMDQGLVVMNAGTLFATMGAGIGAVSFARMLPDGRHARLLRVDVNSVTFLSGEYDRWPTFREEALRLINLAASHGFGEDELSIGELAVQYDNKFIWDGSLEDANPGLLVQQTSKWVHARIFEITENWHCNVGEFQHVDDRTRRLIHVNSAQVVDETTPMPIKSINIQVLLTDALNVPGYDKTTLSGGSASFDWMAAQIEHLHESEKNIVGEILLTDMQQQIRLRQPINV